jgi:hypothetical protein
MHRPNEPLLAAMVALSPRILIAFLAWAVFSSTARADAFAMVFEIGTLVLIGIVGAFRQK